MGNLMANIPMLQAGGRTHSGGLHPNHPNHQSSSSSSKQGTARGDSARDNKGGDMSARGEGQNYEEDFVSHKVCSYPMLCCML